MTAHLSGRPSRRERPAKPALTQDGIISTAVRLTRAEGLQKVTMRRLAQELDTGPASLYVYVRNTAELHAAILDELVGTVDLGAAEGAGDWRERLVRVLVSYTTVLFEQPGLAKSALVARPSGVHHLDLMEVLLALLDEGGVPADRAAWALDLLLQHATATAAEHADRDGAAEAEADRRSWDALSAALLGASRTRHPHLAGLGADLLSGAPEDRLRWGFHVLINGALDTPRPPQA
ncbi:TetR/AcrR family transcriptional regulator [Kitasatospora sp. MBT63]|uniref:TetR/AcrR family transcriptional regulator n=1 Tax=Kitasatospora sp. MBT63 TaxID=1444768 RepID=UPI00053AB1B7|nr:TetR/AcrR family transcriptional regulator [Kitasatospora sp. MBT63]